MNVYNPNIRLVEHNWTGLLQTFIGLNRPFMSDEIVSKLTHELSQNGKAAVDMGSKVLFHFEIVEKQQ